jgi:2-polyprenyl-6-methoxyphenol hydroxylase-like FAD-dependent oxidoreductase
MKPVVIVGGGLAGLTLGIGLRQTGVPVTLYEAGSYPRHRVCGEFISGRGQEVLTRLGLLPLLESCGMRPAETAAWFQSGRSRAIRTDLPEPAWCVSRHPLDLRLAEEFVRLGGHLELRHRWTGSTKNEGIVMASGRRLQSSGDGWRWWALKTHVTNVAMEADLEMHLEPDGYVGLCRLSDGVVNVCGLFRSRGPQPDLAQTWRHRLQGSRNSALHSRLKDATFLDGTFASVAGIALQPQKATEQAEVRIGDALTLIPPVSGNGMSMALESAHLAVEPIRAFSQAKWAWTETQRQVAQTCDATFSRRLRWAGRLQWALFLPVPKSIAWSMASHQSALLRIGFALTR